MYQLRCAAPDDADAVLAVFAPFVTDTIVTFEYMVPSPAAYRAKMAHILQRYPFLACAQDSAVIGFAYADEYRRQTAYGWDAELSIYLDPAHAGHGLGRRMYTALLSLLACQQVVNVYGCIALPNPASERLHRALGFRQQGVLHGQAISTAPGWTRPGMKRPSWTPPDLRPPLSRFRH